MRADDRALFAADEIFEALLGVGDGIVEAFAEGFRVGDFPAGIDEDHQVLAVLRERFLEAAFEVLDAVVELLHLLDRPREFPIQAGLGDRPAVHGLAKGGDERGLGPADLERKEHHREDEQEDASDEEVELASIHGCLNG